MHNGLKKIRNMAELAQVSGISRPTLSKYFDDPQSVKPTTRARSRAALETVDYRPNFHATSLNRKRPRTIGIIVPLIADPFYAETVRQIEVRCLEAGYWAVVLSSHGEADLESRAVETLLSLNAAGAIVAPLGSLADRSLFDRLSSEMPVVFFDSELDGDHVFVGTDNHKSISLITDYLSRTGTAPCFLEMPSVNRNARERREAYIEAMERLGHEPMLLQTEGLDWGFETAGYHAAARALKERSFPSSTILCANDRLAFGVMSAACKAGLSLGRGESADLRVAGHDDHPLSQFSCPALTTVGQDTDGMAALATRLLFESIAQGTPIRSDKRHLLEATLKMRESA